jgi:hypothetical protein
MSVSWIKQSFLDQMKNNINVENYTEGAPPWVAENFNDQNWYQDLDYNFNSSIQLIKGDHDSDFENVKILHKAFDNIWAYYSHTKFWDYMQERWPLKSTIKNPPSFILDHYFVKGKADRGLLRNGIARLWFIGHISYDEKREDPYELTRMVLLNQEVLRTFSERPILMRNKNFRSALLNSMAQNNKPYLDRDKFRMLLEYFVRISGIKRLDALSEDDLTELIQKKLIID